MKRLGWCLVVLGLMVGMAVPAAAQPEPALIVEEYPIVSAEEDSPVHFEFRERLTQDILDVRRAWREQDPAAALPALNEALAPFGYRVEANNDVLETYTLYHADSVVLADISVLFPLALSDSGTDFRLLFEATSEPGVLVMTPDTIGTVDSDHYMGIPPVFVGDDLIEVWGDWNANKFYVRRAGEDIYTVAPEQITVAPPVKALWSWDGQWVLESEGRVIINGEDVTEQDGAAEMFAWRLLHGEPFYFASTPDSSTGANRITMVYTGEEVTPYEYEEVAHYQCCEPSIFNVDGNDTMVWFYALRDGMWYYVEAGIYE